MKKFIIVLLLALSLSALSACGGGELDFYKEDEFTSDGRLIINLFGHDMDDLQSPIEETKLILDMVEEKFQVKFKITTTTYTSSPTLLNQLIGGGDVPDVFIHFRKEPTYTAWVEAEILMNYSPYLKDYPNLEHAFKALGTEREVKMFLNGDYYSYPIIIHRDFEEPGELYAEVGMFYRRDWYQALELKGFKPSSGRELVDPEDPSFNYLNFYDLLEGFTYGDPDGNGIDDTYGYTLPKDEGVYWWYPILNMFEVTPSGWYQNDEGKWLPEATSAEMYEALMFMAEMYDKGFIDPNYSTSTTVEGAKNNFVNGKAGMVVYNTTATMGSGVVDMMKGYVGKVAGSKTMSDVVRGMPVVTGKNDKKMILGGQNNFGYLAINNDVTENKKKKILSIIDWMLSDEGDRLLTWGIENRHYKVLENGDLKSLLALDNNGHQKVLYDNLIAPGIYRLKGLASWETIFTNDPRPYPEVVDQLMSAWKKEYLFIDELAFVSTGPEYSIVQAELDDKIAITFKSIVGNVAGSTPEAKQDTRDSIWNDFVRYYEMKGSKYINEINQRAKELYGE